MTELETLLPFGLTPDRLLVVMAAGTAFMIVIAVWYGLLERDPWQRRARMLADRREELRGNLVRQGTGRRRSKRESLSLMRRVVGALKLMQSQQTTRLYERTAQAGLRSRDAVVVFLFFKMAGRFCWGRSRSCSSTCSSSGTTVHRPGCCSSAEPPCSASSRPRSTFRI